MKQLIIECKRNGWSVFLLVLGLSCSVEADGILEINQACAESGGCFPGDSAGFPVTISSSGSYRLTGNLALSNDLDAIVITTSSVTLDLAGFEISGPGSCTGSGSTIDCGAEGVGSGVWVDNNPDSVTIRNGVISNMRLTGIRAEGNGHLFADLKLRNNHAFGLVADERMIVRNCTAIRNAGTGIKLNDGSIIDGSIAMGNGIHGFQLVNEGNSVYGSTSQGNGEFGFLLDNESRFGNNNASNGNTLGDSCGEGICTSTTRFYLSQTTHTGNSALGACVSGFHMASMWEILDPTKLVYDPVLGRMSNDSGEGPPTEFGWIRTGNPSSPGGAMGSGEANCQSWTSNESGELGTRVGLPIINWAVGEAPPGFVAPWVTAEWGCSTTRPVWCVEDR